MKSQLLQFFPGERSTVTLSASLQIIHGNRIGHPGNVKYADVHFVQVIAEGS